MTERASKKAKGSPLQLKISLHNDEQFEGVPFDMTVFLQDEQGQMKTGFADLALAPSLVFEDNTPVPGPGALVVEGAPTIVNGRATLRCTVGVVSMDVGNRKMCVLLTPTPALGGDCGGVGPVRSVGLLVIRHKLELEAPPGSWDKTWYKDEGGRDKTIPLTVRLVDGSGRTVTGREVSLALFLLYEDGHKMVPKQSVLRAHESSANKIDKRTGKATLKVRIEEVSRSHQHQDFQIKIGPDVVKSPLDQDVGATFSPAVTVLSKRNAKNRGLDGVGNLGGGGSGSRGAASAGGVGGAAAAAVARSAAAASARAAAAARAGMGQPHAAGGAGGGGGSGGGIGMAHPSVVVPAPMSLPHPSGGPGLQSSLENLLGWVTGVLAATQSQQMMNDALLAQVSALQGQVSTLVQQNAATKAVLDAYQSRVMTDLQLFVDDFGRRASAEAATTAEGLLLLHDDPPPPPLPVNESVADSAAAAAGSIGARIRSGANGGTLPLPLDFATAAASAADTVATATSVVFATAVTGDDQNKGAATEPSSSALSSSFPPPPPMMLGGRLLSRQISDSYFSAAGGLGIAAPPLPFAGAEGEGGGRGAGDEGAVAFVVAKIFVTTSAKLGFPAFSLDKALVGFYATDHGSSSGDDGDGSGSGGGGGAMTGGSAADMVAGGGALEFLPLKVAKAAGHLSDENAAAASQCLAKEIARESKSVFQLGGPSSTLEGVKTSALVYFLQKQASGLRASAALARQPSVLTAAAFASASSASSNTSRVAAGNGDVMSGTGAPPNLLDRRQSSLGGFDIGEIPDCEMMRSASDLDTDPMWQFEL